MGLIATALDAMLAAGMAREDIVRAVAAMEAEQETPRSSGAERTRRWRERRKASQSVTERYRDGCDVTCDALSPEVSPPTPPTSYPLSPKENPLKGAKEKPVREAFERFRAEYPRRKGNNPWEPARLRFEAAARGGVDPEAIVAGARRYASEQAALGKVGTEFIMQAKAWLHQKCWQDYAAPSTGPPASDGIVNGKDFIAQLMEERNGRQH